MWVSMWSIFRLRPKSPTFPITPRPSDLPVDSITLRALLWTASKYEPVQQELTYCHVCFKLQEVNTRNTSYHVYPSVQVWFYKNCRSAYFSNARIPIKVDVVLVLLLKFVTRGQCPLLNQGLIQENRKVQQITKCLPPTQQNLSLAAAHDHALSTQPQPNPTQLRSCHSAWLHSTPARTLNQSLPPQLTGPSAAH